MNGFGRLALDRGSSRSLQAQLAAQLKSMIQSGALRPAQRLPSTRALAEHLQISRNTVVAAYETLLGEGYLRSRLRSGFEVGDAAHAFRARPRRTNPTHIPTRAPELPAAPIPFHPTQPDVSLFSLKVWNRYRAHALRQSSTLLHYQSRFPVGLDELRQSVAAYLHDSRGVRCRWDEVAITSGSQQALFLLAQLLLRDSHAVYMEDPGYLGARRAWQSARAHVIPLPVDAEGMCLPPDDGAAASLLYITPSHQFPTGTCMSLARRLAFLELAHRRKLWIIEDDYDAEFRYTSPPQPSLQSLDRNRRILYIGSFSKTLFPALRLGYVVLPPSLVEPFARLKAVADDHGPLLDQATLAAFLEDGAFHAHLRRCRRRYAHRQQLFLDLVQQARLPLRFPVTGQGMNLLGFLPESHNDELWSRRLLHAGLDIPPLSRYSIEPTRPALLFGLTAFSEADIRQGVNTMASVFHRRSRTR